MGLRAVAPAAYLASPEFTGTPHSAATNPLYLLGNSPSVGFNAYYSSGWKAGPGSGSRYGGVISFDQTTGTLDCWVSSNQAANGAALTAVDLWFGTASGLTLALDTTISAGKVLKVGTNQVVAARRTGWTAWTGTATRTTFATGTATLTNVAEALKALIDDLIAHGLIGT